MKSQHIHHNYKNILSNYIPHETITCDDRDPPWINKNIKQLTLEENKAYKSDHRGNKSLQFLNQFQFLQTVKLCD